jgi:hypothetical protein
LQKESAKKKQNKPKQNTPYPCWKQKKSNNKHLKIVGSDSFVVERNAGKLEFKPFKCKLHRYKIEKPLHTIDIEADKYFNHDIILDKKYAFQEDLENTCD